MLEEIQKINEKLLRERENLIRAKIKEIIRRIQEGEEQVEECRLQPDGEISIFRDMLTKAGFEDGVDYTFLTEEVDWNDYADSITIRVPEGAIWFSDMYGIPEFMPGNEQNLRILDLEKLGIDVRQINNSSMNRLEKIQMLEKDVEEKRERQSEAEAEFENAYYELEKHKILEQIEKSAQTDMSKELHDWQTTNDLIEPLYYEKGEQFFLPLGECWRDGEGGPSPAGFVMNIDGDYILDGYYRFKTLEELQQYTGNDYFAYEFWNKSENIHKLHQLKKMSIQQLENLFDGKELEEYRDSMSELGYTFEQFIQDTKQVAFGEKRPAIICTDGYSVSVQASSNHASSPRVDGLTEYDEYEVYGITEAQIEQLADWVQKPYEEHPIYEFVPKEEIKQLILEHGGLDKEIMLAKVQERQKIFEPKDTELERQIQELSGGDEFLANILRYATRKVEVRDQNSKAAQLAQDYEQQLPTNQQSLDNE